MGELAFLIIINIEKMRNILRTFLLILSVFSTFNCNLKFLNEVTPIEIKDYLLYINGFLNGTHIGQVAPNIFGCDLSDTGLYTSVIDFSIYIKNDTWKHQSVLILVEDVSASFSYIFGNFSKIFHYCKVAPFDSADLVKALAKYLSSPLVYLGTVVSYIVKNPYQIYKEYVRSKILLEQNKPYEAGQIVGDLLSTVFFPKLNSNLALFYLKEETTEFEAIEELFSCGVTTADISKKVVLSVREFVRIFRSTGSFTNLYSNLKEIIGEVSSSLSQCLKTSTRLAKILLKIIFDRK